MTDLHERFGVGLGGPPNQ